MSEMDRILDRVQELADKRMCELRSLDPNMGNSRNETIELSRGKSRGMLIREIIESEKYHTISEIEDAVRWYHRTAEKEMSG